MGGTQMSVENWISVMKVLAWPCVAILGLIYIWRSDAVTKLIQIADAVKDLKSKLAELVQTEQQLSDRSIAISDITSSLKQVISDSAEIKAEVENIRDRLEEENKFQNPQNTIITNISALEDFKNIEKKWSELLNLLQNVFGYFDKRSVAGEVYRYTHGNRKGPRLTYDTAEEIARLHSSIKSFRRRKAAITNWLDKETYSRFISACDKAIEDISSVAKLQEMPVNTAFL
jgi:regulator of replication initiation timing